MFSTQILMSDIKTKKGHLQEYGISDKEFEQKIQEAEEDIKNGNLYTLEEVIDMGLEVLKTKIPEMPIEEQQEAQQFINSWRI